MKSNISIVFHPVNTYKIIHKNNAFLMHENNSSLKVNLKNNVFLMQSYQIYLFNSGPILEN